jgi:cyclopropane fatty-acyl-phospholipid synthase-like methyltransferase
MNTRAMERADFRAIAHWVKPAARVLDLGCGDGTLLRYLG